MNTLLVIVFFIAACVGQVLCFQPVNLYRYSYKHRHTFQPSEEQLLSPKTECVRALRRTGMKPLKDVLGLGVPEIALIVVAGLVLFGPETLKSLSKDVGRAAAELKEIPKTFKEGMEEGQQQAQISKLKEMAAEKRKKRLEMESSTEESSGGEKEN